MCEILGTHSIAGKIIIDCSPYNGDFASASILRIVDKDNRIFETSDFGIEKARACFSKGGNPWIMVNKDIPANFLSRGNEIILQ